MILEYKNLNSNYILPENSLHLKNLKKINIFIGSNNSGKSRFLRSIFLSKSDNFLIYEDKNNILTDIHETLKPKFIKYYYMSDLESLISTNTGDYAGRYNDFINRIKNRVKQGQSSSTGGISDLIVAQNILNSMADKGLPEKIEPVDINFFSLYVPMLRGMRHLDVSTDKADEKIDVYHKRTNEDYSLGWDGVVSPESKEIFTGMSIYKDLKRMLLGSREEREFVRQFEKFLSNKFFQNKSITLIPDHDSDVVKINMNDEDDRKIFDIGDGIQSIIINTFAAFKHQDKKLIMCIEEPELTMHPSMQRVLIETFVNDKRFTNVQIFITTHSNHFLDLTYDYPEDVCIFSFEKDDNSKFLVQDVTNKSKIIDLLGIRNSSVFLSNSVIWTEGVTDRMLIRKLLQISNFAFKEDYHYTFAEYGGSNLENFNFEESEDVNAVKVRANSFNRTNYIIMDNDNITDIKNIKFIRREKIKSLLGKDNCFDSYVEVENLVPFKVWVKVIEKMLELKPNKKIKLKENLHENEASFNKEISTNRIGLLLKKYLIDLNDIQDEPVYYKTDTVMCLGESKKHVMEIILNTIDESKISLTEFPDIAKDLISSIKSFVEKVNK